MTDNLTERVTITLLTGIVSYYFPSALLYEQHFLNVQLSFCLISCNSCYVILVLAGLWYCFLQKTLTICQSSHILNITLLWLFLKKGYLQVCVLKITSCVCVFVWALKSWALEASLRTYTWLFCRQVVWILLLGWLEGKGSWTSCCLCPSSILQKYSYNTAFLWLCCYWYKVKCLQC